MKKRQEYGIAHMSLLLLLVLAAVAFAGYKVYNNNQNKSSEVSQTPAPTASVTVIKSKADLNGAINALNNENIDSTLDTSQLDSDVNNLL
jgi:hypothetical protein